MPDSNQKIRIGIPRTLFYYYYYPFCCKFLNGLDAEVVVSDKTNREILQAGLNTSSNELCLPIKLLYGHVLNLKDRTDYIFLPYMISMEEGSYYCPKLIGSPDIVKANIPDVKLLSLDIDMDNFYSSLLASLREIAKTLSLNPIKIYGAYKSALAYQRKFNKFITSGLTFDDALKLIDSDDARKTAAKILAKENDKPVAVAIIGHTYVFNDAYTSFDIITKLRERNVRVLTSDMLTDSQIKQSIIHVEKKPHWSLSKRVLGAAINYSKNPKVDGIIYVTPFGCSSDSLIKEYIDANIETSEKKPLMTLMVDEHSSDAGFITRIEAFLDMIERKKNKIPKYSNDERYSADEKDDRIVKSSSDNKDDDKDKDEELSSIPGINKILGELSEQ